MTGIGGRLESGRWPASATIARGAGSTGIGIGGEVGADGASTGVGLDTWGNSTEGSSTGVGVVSSWMGGGGEAEGSSTGEVDCVGSAEGSTVGPCGGRLGAEAGAAGTSGAADPGKPGSGGSSTVSTGAGEGLETATGAGD